MYVWVNPVVITGRLLQFEEKKTARGGPNGITFISNVMQIAQSDQKQKATQTHTKDRDNSVGIGTHYGLDGPVIESR